MIHSTTQGGKFRRLVRRLRPLLDNPPCAVETIAVGLLERLWHATICGAIRGDIGRFDNEEIAEMIGWHGDADSLLTILADENWLDRSDEHRLLVHDWPEHAPRHVKANVVKVGGFLTHERPVKAPPNDEKEVDMDDKAPPLSAKAATPNVTKPNLTKPNPTERTAGCAGAREAPSESVGRSAGREIDSGNGRRILVSRSLWDESRGMRERIARVVSFDVNVTLKKLRAPDREMCIKVAALVHRHPFLNMAWIDGVLNSIKRRKNPPEKPWAFFRGALVKSAIRVGIDFHEAEALVELPAGHAKEAGCPKPT